jgi:hypothetical protein
MAALWQPACTWTTDTRTLDPYKYAGKHRPGERAFGSAYRRPNYALTMRHAVVMAPAAALFTCRCDLCVVPHLPPHDVQLV